VATVTKSRKAPSVDGHRILGAIATPVLAVGGQGILDAIATPVLAVGGQGILDALATPVFAVDCRLQYTAFNSAHAAVMRQAYGAEIALGRSVLECHTVPLDGELMKTSFARALKGETVVSKAWVGPEGNRRFYWTTHSPIRDGDKIVGAAVVSLDLTDRELVAQNQALVAAIVESSDDAIMSISTNGRILSLNPGAEKMYGYSAKEAIGQSVWLLVPFEEREDIRDMHALVEQGQCIKHYETVRIRKDRGLLDVSMGMWPLRDGSGAVVGTSSIGRDVTAERTAAAVLQASRERFRATFEQAAIGIAQVGLDGRWLEANDCLCQMLGYSLEELRSLTFADVSHPDERDRDVEALQTMLLGGIGTYYVEKRYIAKDGGTVWVNVAVTLARDSTGEPDYLVTVVEDIRDRKQAEDSLLEANSRLEQMAYDIASLLGRVEEARDPYTQGHELHVAELSGLIAEQMGLSDDEVASIRMAALLHDVGKLSVPADILSKPGALSAAQMALVREHSANGYEILKDIDFPWPIADAVLHHHERMDGSGYPDGLKGKDILLPARVIAVADVVEAMASHRPYRAALGVDAAVAEIKDHPDKYDPDVSAACIRLFEAGLLPV
jgi:PAS domain S-box-containing protein/putative nucleotidyltransferase with HDIG domain